MPTVTYVKTPEVSHGTCYRCGNSVDFIKNLSGKTMLFDPVAVDREDDDRAAWLLLEITPGVARARHSSTGKRRPSERKILVHNATCPDVSRSAKRNRRRAA